MLSVGKGGRNQDGDLIFSGSLWPPRQHCIRGEGGGREGLRRKTVVKFLAELTEADARRGYARVSGKEGEELSNSGRSPQLWDQDSSRRTRGFGTRAGNGTAKPAKTCPVACGPKKNSAVPGVRPNSGTRRAAGGPRGSEQELGMALQSQPSQAPWPLDPAKPKACRARPKQRVYVFCHVQNHQVLLVNVW